MRPRSKEIALGNGIFGSTTATKFFNDCRNGVDSVDVVPIGDSNAGSQGSGWTCGLAYAMAGAGMKIYATPIFQTANAVAGNNRIGGMCLPHNLSRWLGNATAAGGNFGSTVANPLTTAVTASSAPAIELKNTLSFDQTITPSIGSFAYNIAYVDTGVLWSSPANGPEIQIYESSSMLSGGGGGNVPLQYRLVYGQFTQSGGSFKLKVMHTPNTAVQTSGSFSTASAASGFATATLDFNSPLNSGVPRLIHCAFDGYNTIGDGITGPFAAIWHSVVEIAKGYCVSSLIYDSGKTSSQIADRVEGMGTTATSLMGSYLKELRERQIAAGGSGRVVIWNNTGVNGPDTGTAFVDAMTRIRNAFSTVWVALGYPKIDLAFIFSVTHPQISGSSHENSLITQRTSANNWAEINKNDGNNVTVVDISKLFTYTEMTQRNMYSIVTNAQYEAHLRGMETLPLGATGSNLFKATYTYDVNLLNNGYAIVANQIVGNLMKAST